MNKRNLIIAVVVLIAAGIAAMGIILHQQQASVSNDKPQTNQEAKKQKSAHKTKPATTTKKAATSDDHRQEAQTSSSNETTPTTNNETNNRAKETTTTSNKPATKLGTPSQAAPANQTANPAPAKQTDERNGLGDVVHNETEAINILKNALGNNSDFGYQVLSTANHVYEIQVISKSIKQQGGSGTVGIYRVMEDGSYGLRP